MNERERLIELLLESEPIKDRDLDDNWYDGEISDIAEYLLENGVIVPPVKIGDTVYGISRGAIVPISIDRIQHSSRGIDILGRNERYFGNGTITLHPNNEMWIEWYKTKEEAEKHLKGGTE